MKRYRVPVFCSVFLFAGWTAIEVTDMATSMRTWMASIKRFHDIAQKAGADTFLSIHPQHDKTFDKLTAVRFRKPGAPHPFVNKEFIANHTTVMTECMEAQLAWLKAAGSN